MLAYRYALFGVNLIFSLALIPTSTVAAEKAAEPESLPSLLTFTPYEVEWKGRPRDPAVAPDGMVWFCGQAGNYIARLNPDTGRMKQFSVPEGSHPHNLIVDSDGFVWYAGNQNGHIGRMDPETGDIKQYPMPEAIRDPHTLVFDKNENIWFTAQHSNAIGHLNTETGEVRYVKATEPRSRPYGIKMDSNDQPWVVLVGTNKLATVNKDDFSLEEISIPREDARPRRLEITSDDSIWYVDFRDGYLGQYIPDSDSFNEWLTPDGEGSQPYGTALDSEGRLWIGLTGPYPNVMVGFDTDSEEFISRTVVKSGGSVRHMYFDPEEKVFWFGVDTGFIVRAKPQ
ncbi:Vgb family protein [Kangiella sediminilitoris]|uniref:Streptogramin lyase n=1 Tax=Kangiella sediminilitoris TaxID=1144748 RepID=A0A1B3B9W9_9GAMM|nr:lyase [Kangiella sediminilitoris]AOE49597.1 Streptogramin lyase [Kangiella sediminilitoris]